MRCSRAGHPEKLLQLSRRSAPSNWLGVEHTAPMRRGVQAHRGAQGLGSWPGASTNGRRVLYLVLMLRETLVFRATCASLSASGKPSRTFRDRGRALRFRRLIR